MLILIAFQSDFADVSRSTARIELALFSDLNAGGTARIELVFLQPPISETPLASSWLCSHTS